MPGAEPDNVDAYEYDAPDLPVRITRSGQVTARLDYDAGGRLKQRIESEGEGEVVCDRPIHSADSEARNTIRLTELLRVIPFFKPRWFSCDPALTSEDANVGR